MPSSACDWSSDVCSSDRSEEHTSELQSRSDLVCRLLLEKKKKLPSSRYDKQPAHHAVIFQLIRNPHHSQLLNIRGVCALVLSTIRNDTALCLCVFCTSDS